MQIKVNPFGNIFQLVQLNIKQNLYLIKPKQFLFIFKSMAFSWIQSQSFWKGQNDKKMYILGDLVYNTHQRTSDLRSSLSVQLPDPFLPPFIPPFWVWMKWAETEACYFSTHCFLNGIENQSFRFISNMAAKITEI